MAQGVWETRYGSTQLRTMPGSGTLQLIFTGYKANGARVRIAVRGGGVYKWDEGDDGSGDVAWQTVAAGGTLSSSAYPVRACQVGIIVYLVDGVNIPYKYTLGGSGGAVSLPTAPGAAPTATARPWGYLEIWDGNGGAAPFGWTESSNGDFDILDSTATDPSPGKGKTVKLRAKSTSAKSNTISEDVAGEKPHSRKIAFYFQANNTNSRIGFEVGTNNKGEQNFTLKPPKGGDWYLVFCDIGLAETLGFKQFRILQSPDGTYICFISRMWLPGKLQGTYQHRNSYYNSTANLESELSPAGSTLDLSQIGTSYHNETEGALRKCAALTHAKSAESGVDYVRYYRSGGVRELSLDPATGRQIWIYVGQVKNVETTLAGGGSIVGAASITLTSATNIAQDDWLVIDRTGTPEIRRIKSLAGAVATLDEPLDLAHSAGVAVGIAFLDNVANEELDPTNRIDVERDGPPTGPAFIDQAPDGALWLSKWPGRSAGYAVGNHPTAERPLDYEVFPDGVDPLTRQDILQGWRGDVRGHAGGEEIVWFGFFNQVPTFLTKTGVWQLNALRQTDYGPNALYERIHGVGCVSSDTVANVGGVLYWVTDGNRVVRWDGESAPQAVSNPNVRKMLEAAPGAYLGSWFAVSHAKRDGNYYCLFFVPSGGTTCTDILEYNQDGGTWEHASYWTNSTTRLAWKLAHVPKQGGDLRTLWAVDSGGQIWQLDDQTARLDGANPIRVQWQTKRIAMGATCALEWLWIRLPGVTSDTLTVTVTTGGSEYGTQSQTYTFDLSGSGDLDLRKRLHHQTLKGRWFQLQFDGAFSYLPAPRDVLVQATVIRADKLS